MSTIFTSRLFLIATLVACATAGCRICPGGIVVGTKSVDDFTSDMGACDSDSQANRRLAASTGNDTNGVAGEMDDFSTCLRQRGYLGVTEKQLLSK